MVDTSRASRSLAAEHTALTRDVGIPPEKRQRLTKEQIRYLVFEGGGGKGFAYLGAMRVLETLNVLSYRKPNLSDPVSGDGERHSRLDNTKIYGVAGGSAGAITAFMVSIGYTTKELSDMMSDPNKFLSFYDGGFNGTISAPGSKVQKVRRMRPIYGGCLPVADTEEEAKRKRNLGFAASFIGLEMWIAKWEGRLGIYGLEQLADLIEAAQNEIKEIQKSPPFDTIIAHWKDFVVNFSADWGLFSACAARQLFDDLLAARLPLKNGKRQKNATFKDHFDYFKVELLVTGTNILTGKSEVFSARDTPDFYVADAVRISMGIPFAFKPVRIQDEPAASDTGRRGVWVDGGLLNNLPFREFDDRPGPNPKTLAIRLDVERPAKKIENFNEFIKNYFSLALLGPGEAYITSKYVYQTIVLDTYGLSLLNFAPDPRTREKVEAAAEVTTGTYFVGSRDKPSKTITVKQLFPPSHGVTGTW